MSQKIIPYGRQEITNEDIELVVESLKSDFLTQGPTIFEFERKFAEYVGSKYAVAVNNGTAALHLCTLVMNVNEYSNIITTPITFVASANCIKYCNGNVWFADIDPVTYTLDILKVEALIESKPKGFFTGIIPVDFAGFAVNMEAFRNLANKHGLWIIEDACHAPGGFFLNSKKQKEFCGNGKYADLSIFSFHPVKHIACGEGGMITTNDITLYQKLLSLRTHGITKEASKLTENHGFWYYEMQELGFNYRLTDFQAALGISQLKRADNGLEIRRELARRYKKAFKDKKYILSQSDEILGHAYHLYIIQVENRKGLYDYLRLNNIFCQVHYIPVHFMPYYKSLGYKKGSMPISEKYYELCLSLPMFPSLTFEEQNFVIKTIDEFYQN
jgi:UDP-4-amino-4,6-dideoxy-N-acetyl-beta-L-altrosamine transaminase